MKNYYLFPFILCVVGLLGLSSCENEHHFEVKDFKSKMVVNAIFDTESKLSIDISSSRNILLQDSEIKPVIGADVQVKDRDGYKVGEIMDNGDGTYTNVSPHDLRQGEVYTLTVVAEGYEDVTSTTNVPYSVIAVVDTVEAIVHEGQLAYEVTLTMTDEDSTDNYYVWEILDNAAPQIKNDLDFSQVLNGPVLLNSADTETILPNEQFQTRLFISDKIFETSNLTTKFTALSRRDKSNTDENVEVLQENLKIRVMTVSKDLYEFYKSVEFYRLKGEVNSSITQPHNIYSNIDNGLGIFAGYTDVIIE